MTESNIQPGMLLALRGPNQYKRRSGQDTSAIICTAVHETGVGVHVKGQRLPNLVFGQHLTNNDESEGQMTVVDDDLVESAGLIIKTAPSENSVFVKVPSSPIHPELYINAVTTTGWVLVTADNDPFLGEHHWIPGCFGGSTTTYYFGPIEDEARFRMEVEGYQVSEDTRQQLRLNGVELEGQSSFSNLRNCDLLDDASGADKQS